MKRFTHPILWSILVSLILGSTFVFERRTRAQELVSTQSLTTSVSSGRKVSKDLVQKLAEGRGGDVVRVVIQPVTQPELSLDSAIDYSGGSDVRKLKNSRTRIVTLPVSAAIAVGLRHVKHSYLASNTYLQ